MSRTSVAAATGELVDRDPVMAKLVAIAGPAKLKRRGNERRDHFGALARSITYQQLAGAAAAAIHGRFEALFDGGPTPEAVLATPEEKLRGAGLSAAKTASIIDLATKVESGVVPLDGIGRLSDDEIVERLSSVRGIGRWTAEMFLIFQLGRLDVWPVGDLGVRKGYATAWGLPAMPTPKELVAYGETFRPYRSVAAWYCWRAVDTVVPDSSVATPLSADAAAPQPPAAKPAAGKAAAGKAAAGKAAAVAFRGLAASATAQGSPGAGWNRADRDSARGAARRDCRTGQNRAAGNWRSHQRGTGPPGVLQVGGRDPEE